MIDTHCHIDYPQYQEDFDTFIARQKAGGVSKIIVPGVSAESIQTVNAVCEKYPDYLLAGIGLHPTEVKEDWQEQMQQIANELPKNYIALGETGLDYHEDITFIMPRLRSGQRSDPVLIILHYLRPSGTAPFLYFVRLRISGSPSVIRMVFS